MGQQDGAVVSAAAIPKTNVCTGMQSFSFAYVHEHANDYLTMASWRFKKKVSGFNSQLRSFNVTHILPVHVWFSSVKFDLIQSLIVMLFQQPIGQAPTPPVTLLPHAA